MQSITAPVTAVTIPTMIRKLTIGQNPNTPRAAMVTANDATNTRIQRSTLVMFRLLNGSPAIISARITGGLWGDFSPHNFGLTRW